ncbi:MAG: hypothetical protein SOU51_05320 [Collinsella sp.]|nr:hypothetical protein [Collinsella sp.]
MNGISLADQVEAFQIEKVTFTKTDEGIWFHIPKSGFSPFSLVWTTPDTGISTPDATIPQTGDASPLIAGSTMLAGCGAIAAGAFALRRKNR